MFPNFSCPVYKIGDDHYQEKRYQYATTSQLDPAKMSPAAIIYPQHPNADPDVLMAIRYAADNNLAIAVRTGGHAYSGTSSTNSNNIQLDLRQAYYEWDYNPDTGLLRVGISYSLNEFNSNLKDMGLFMPTGQCYDVHVGGHAQTGGYGQLARAFGLFGDQIVSFEIFLADGTKRVVSANSTEKFDKDLFFAVLGGGPGNYGIVTHITVRPFKDSDHKYARAFKKIIPYVPKYDHKVLVKLLDLTQEWENAPGDYDFSFTLAAGEENFIESQIGTASKDAFMVKHFGEKNQSSPFNVLLIYFQYSNLDNKPDSYDPTWCNKIEAILRTAKYGNSWWERFKLWVEQKILNFLVTRDNSKITPISECVTKLWTFEGEREFDYPFLKNGQVTDKVASKEWSELAAKKIDEMTGRNGEGLMIFAQCQNFGGKHSAVRKNAERKQTAYAWRNTTVGYEFDVFYNKNMPGAYEQGRTWRDATFDMCIKEQQFSKDDHRWLWASHGNLNMNEMWPHYYTPDDYKKCLEVKMSVDPKGVFSANPFAIGYKPDKASDNEAAMADQIEKILDDAAFTKGHIERAKKRAKAKGIDATKLFR